MNKHIHKTITGDLYEVKNKGGRRALPPELKLSKRIVGCITASMRDEVDEWIGKGYRESLIIQLALRDWLDKEKSVQ